MFNIRLSPFVVGLGPATHEVALGPDRPQILVMPGGWVYIMTNRPNGTLYVGVTDNLVRRVWEHREALIDGFTQQYGLKRLVYAEHHDDIRQARQRERNVKHYPRAWKVRLILASNPSGDDLYERVA